MGADRAAPAARAQQKSARDLERHPLCADDRLPMAPTAERLAAQEHGARLLRRMAVRRHAAAHPSRALYAGARACRQRGQPDHDDRRQPERERRRKRGARIDPAGYDAAKKIKGKKRHVAVDTLGLMLAVAVTPASVPYRDQIAPLLREVRRLFPFLERAIADSGYRGATTAAAVKKSARLPLEIVKRSDTAQRLRRAAQALDRGVHVRLARPPPPPRKGLRAMI